MIDTFWSGDNSRRIQQRIIVHGELVLQTPAQFGSGDSDDLTDMPLLVDASDGISPLLTGTTLAGALRAYLHSREQGYRQPDQPGAGTLTELLFGGFKGDDDGKQSALIVDDALGENYSVELRDGVRLDPQTRTAVEGGLFDMQVWSAGTMFPIRLELLITHPRDVSTENLSNYQKRLRQALLTALQGLVDGGITLGGRKNRGFGRIDVTHWHIRQYDLTKPTQLMAWLMEGDKPLAKVHCVDKLEDADAFDDIKPTVDKRNYFQIEATFKLDGSLLIRATGQPNSNSPDMVHLSNHEGQPVLPGTSVAGALRQRARRILQLVNEENSAVWLNELFGDEEMRGDFRASRLTIEETLIEQPQFGLVQNRVAIDRFTGGALETALFNEQPVFGKDETRLQINLTVRKPEERDIGLLLLLLKDLWTGDLPLGGEVSVGRGRLAGKCAKLTLFEQGQKQTWQIKQNKDGKQLKIMRMQDDSAKEPEEIDGSELQQFVDALHGKGEQNESEN